MNGFWWGFLTCFIVETVLVVWWFHGTGKEWLDKQRQQLRDKL